jgi:hypothetical protein
LEVKVSSKRYEVRTYDTSWTDEETGEPSHVSTHSQHRSLAAAERAMCAPIIEQEIDLLGRGRAVTAVYDRESDTLYTRDPQRGLVQWEVRS